MRSLKYYLRCLIVCFCLLPSVSIGAEDESGSQSAEWVYDQRPSVVHINGFLTAGVSQANPEVNTMLNKFSDDLSFDTKTLLGLQGTLQLSDKFDVTAQIVAKADRDWDVDLDWVFFRYRLADDLSFRAGRLRLPFYLFSESADVGFSYPWVSPPTEMYLLPLVNYEGVDLLYSASAGDWIHQFQVVGGSVDKDNFKTSYNYGVNLTSSSGPWTYRASFLALYDVEFGLPPLSGQPLVEVEDPANYYAMAAMYDDGDWLLISELSVVDTAASKRLFGSDAGYLTVGRHLGRWLPHVTYAKSYTKDDSPPEVLYNLPSGRPVTANVLKYASTSYTLGLRYNLNANSSLKLQWSHFVELDDTGGKFFNLRFPNPNRAAEVDNVDTYSLVIHMVF